MGKVNIPEIPFQVFVRCMTYNHSKYILDALNGFVMQKTDFPYVCVVIDDASTDGEQDIIKAFLEREFDFTEDNCNETDDAQVIVAKHKSNGNCTFAVYFLKENHYSVRRSKTPYINPWREKCKYEALCEGDDYWIDPLKLQKQYDILENNPDVSMVFHKAKILKEIPAIEGLHCFDIEDREYSATELFAKWIVPTASMLFRIECLQYPIRNSEDILNGDIFLVEKCAHTGKVLGVSEFMSVYRMQSAGITYDSKMQYDRTMRYPKHFECIALNFPLIDKKIINKVIASWYWNKASLPNNFERKHDFYMGIKIGPWRMTVKQINKRLRNKFFRLFGNTKRA